MSKLIWAKVFYQDQYAGVLKEEPGDRTSFQYDDSYLNNSVLPPIAHTLPKEKALYTSRAGLIPFFDNLVAEGWLEQAQTRLLGKRQATRLELLMTFGEDCIGAVSIIDPEPVSLKKAMVDRDDPKEMAILTSRASLSGVQPKMAIIEKNKKFQPAKINEVSTYIAKFPSEHHDDLVINEYLTMQAFNVLLPTDTICDMQLGEIKNIPQQALIIKRFDREQKNKLHFEEFNQLLNYQSKNKYDADYKELADFMRDEAYCAHSEIYLLYKRILAGILLGNTDMHLKNFAMLHTLKGLRLTPSYDQVAASLYKYNALALSIDGVSDILIGRLKARTLVRLGESFKIDYDAIDMAVNEINTQREKAAYVIASGQIGSDKLKDQLIKLMSKRWNQSFNLIGKALSKKR